MAAFFPHGSQPENLCADRGNCCTGRSDRCVSQRVLRNHTLDRDRPCYCDSSCLHLSDCCTDYHTFCAAGPDGYTASGDGSTLAGNGSAVVGRIQETAGGPPHTSLNSTAATRKRIGNTFVARVIQASASCSLLKNAPEPGSLVCLQWGESRSGTAQGPVLVRLQRFSLPLEQQHQLSGQQQAHRRRKCWGWVRILAARAMASRCPHGFDIKTVYEV